jgi:hypothetical protein
MPTFILTPNLRILNRYLTKTTDEDFDRVNPNYLPISIEVKSEWKVFENETKFSVAFQDILADFNLVDHYDNLLCLTINSYDQVWEYVERVYQNYLSTLRAREIGKLISLFNSLNFGELNEITFKSKTKRLDKTKSTKTTDPYLNNWIIKTIVTALEQKEFPPRVFGRPVSQLLSSCGKLTELESFDLEKLESIQKERLVSYNNSLNKGYTALCLTILAYLNTETKLSTSGTKHKYKDRQLNLIYKILLLLGQSNDKRIKSLGKDYTRALIENVLKEYYGEI